MNIEFKKFIPSENHFTFNDSIKLMKYNFTDPSATSEEFLKWLYLDNPFGRAIGYIAYDGDIPASQLFITFQNGRYEGKDYKIGIASNACTMPNYRKKGLYYKIFTMLVKDCNSLGIPFIWAYPNPASLRGFLKTGFEIKMENCLVVIPVNYHGLLKEVLKKEKFKIMGETRDLDIFPENNDDFEVLDDSEDISLPLDRDADSTWHTPLDPDQLRWRYLNHPTRKYYLLRHIETNECILLRFISLFGMKPGIILKTSCRDRKTFGLITRNLKKYLHNKINFMMMLKDYKLSKPIPDSLKGRFALPGIINPRRFPLAVYPIDKKLIGIKDKFSFALGDYEVL